MDGDEPGGPTSLYRVLVDRFRSLELSHAELRQEFDELILLKQTRKNHAVMMTSNSDLGCVPGHYSEGSPYRKVLESMGPAVYVCTTSSSSSSSSGEIIFWNHSAENLYGWKVHEVLGQKPVEFLIAEEYHSALMKIMEMLSSGQSWSGQFPYKNRSGQVFMAMVTKSPFYKDGELAGIITVSSDAAIFNTIDSNFKKYEERNRVCGLNLKKIRWNPPRPQIASSVSNLASKLLLRRHGDDTLNASVSSKDKDTTETEDLKIEKSGTVEEKINSNFNNGKSPTVRRSFWKDESVFEFAQPSKIAAKVLAKLHVTESGNCGGESDGNLQKNGVSDKLVSNEVTNELNSPRGSTASIPYQCTSCSEDKEKRPSNKKSKSPCSDSSEEGCNLASSRECNDYCALTRLGESLPTLGRQDDNELDPDPDGKQFFSMEESIDSHESSSSKGDAESNCIVDCEIHWEDLLLGDEIGQGSYAVVYRGMWNGSDVAVKVYFGNEYSEGTIDNYQKEVDIMKKLRHPNVLLFMGAVYSQERLAIVTEFLPRGSLFKTLHKNNQALDIRRRLRMALDVARGMNYLHRRNPPIVHRDLKSSNLLVDRNWTVKVGDFGLSTCKNATYLTAKSERGTPQWMAPEVLRNEPSNEKSDVFSFGVILWELMTVSIPWNHLNSLQVVGVVGFMDRRLDLPEGLDPQLASVIRDCWQSDPDKRPSFQDIIQRMSILLLHRALARKSSEH
ncbi:hypothetical protein Ddye_003222 [Dipteronia dyeriana]|uniref:non-specific serine/threonine protein kinase n=1 Tax=Dipteronia dyeriana TaxID=168575 RepID=A0AAE0CVS3_9ROSI|nr:hypothetical protein Ddye_003222 [Dipteronia dyeriana]